MKPADPYLALAQGYRSYDLGVSLRNHGSVAHNGVVAMLSILAASWDGGRARFGAVATATGLGPERLAGRTLYLEDDGCLIFERDETLCLASSGRVALEEFGHGAAHPSDTLDERP